MKMIVDRMRNMLKKLISHKQTGYVLGRLISMNLWKVIDTLLFLEREEIPILLVSVDFEKCFNSVEHSLLIAAMKYFNIGDYLINWVVTIYNQFQLCVTNNGKISQVFQQQRGVRQGCALSGPAFLLCTET